MNDLDWTVIGIDLSLNHAGLVELDHTGGVSWYDYVTDTKGCLSARRGILVAKYKGADRQQGQLERLMWWRRYFVTLFGQRHPAYVGIEDYAFKAQSNSAYQIGELGGVARLAAIEAHAMLRLHDPTSVKLFAAHSGNATADEVLKAVGRERFADVKVPAPKNGKPNQLALEDLAAAYAVARLVWTEVKLRAGQIKMDELHHSEVQVFNRVTKSNPTNLLGRDFLEMS